MAARLPDRTRNHARTPAHARVLDDIAPTLLAVADDADAAHLNERCELLRIPRARHGLDLAALLAGLLARDVRGLLLEGGPTLAGSFVAAGLIDHVIAYIAPALLGAGRPGLVDAGITTMDDIQRLETLDIGPSGPDVRIIARPRR